MSPPTTPVHPHDLTLQGRVSKSEVTLEPSQSFLHGTALSITPLSKEVTLGQNSLSFPISLPEIPGNPQESLGHLTRLAGVSEDAPRLGQNTCSHGPLGSPFPIHLTLPPAQLLPLLRPYTLSQTAQMDGFPRHRQKGHTACLSLTGWA